MLTGLGDAMFCQKACTRAVEWASALDVDSLICSIRHCECDGHAVHKLSQRRLTADLLDSRESDCSRMRSKVFSNWLPSYIKATRTVLEIFKMDGYLQDMIRKIFMGIK